MTGDHSFNDDYVYKFADQELAWDSMGTSKAVVVGVLGKAPLRVGLFKNGPDRIDDSMTCTRCMYEFVLGAFGNGISYISRRTNGFRDKETVSLGLVSRRRDQTDL